MVPQKQPEPLWVVVKVESGIPVMVEAYRDKQSAEMREQSWRKYMHPENDETGVFEIQADWFCKRQGAGRPNQSDFD